MTGTRGVRGPRRCVRAGTVGADQEGEERWVGFAGLRQTTVERLFREGADGDEDVAASDRPLAKELTSLRHLYGGECAASQTPEIRAVVKGMCERLKGARQTVESAGGRGSTLHAQLAEAEQYLRQGSMQRRAAPAAGWEAYWRVIGVDLEKPDWRLTGGGREEGRLASGLAHQLHREGQRAVEGHAHRHRGACHIGQAMRGRELVGRRST